MTSVLDPVTARFIAELTAATAPMADGGSDFAVLRKLAGALASPIFEAYAEPGPDVATVTDVVLPGWHGDDVRARLYAPLDVDRPPIHLFVHGGGWWQGSIDEWIVDCHSRERCAGAGVLVVSLEYRKAPEHPFPTGLEDCWSALTWVVEHAEELGADASRVTTSGVSAGANLAAALSLLARDRGGPTIAHQVLEVLPADLDVDRSTAWDTSDAGGLTPDGLREAVRWYVPDDDLDNPLVSPLMATDLSGLPSSSVLVADLDPLRLGAVELAGRLDAAGVPTVLHRFPGFIHHSPIATAELAEARRWRSLVIDAIRDGGRTP